MKRILSIDGGGVLGTIPLMVLKSMEQNLGKPICETFDLIVGTSIGAAVGGVLSTGKMTAEKLSSTMLSAFEVIFKNRYKIPILQKLYRISDIRDFLDSYLKDMTMSQCKTKFFSTSLSYIDGLTHFFKSWEEKDGKLNLTEAIIRSVSAPVYFGKTVDKVNKGVWGDGGCGNMVDPSMQAYIEASRQGWLGKEPVHIISLGCGDSFKGDTFEKCSKFNNLQEIAYYFNLASGGLARAQSDKTYEAWLQTLSEGSSGFTTQRIQEFGISKKIDKLDGIKYIPEFIKVGEKLAKEVDYSFFK
jgi:hypothetical protein